MGLFTPTSRKLRTLLLLTAVVSTLCPSAFATLAWKKPGGPVDHFAARITPMGLESILKAILEKYSDGGSKTLYVIPKSRTQSVVTLSKDKYETLMSLSQEFFDLDFEAGISLFVRTSAVKLSATVSDSLQLLPVTTDENGFEADLSVKFTDFSAKIPVISVCDRADCDPKQGLRMDLKKIVVAQSARSVPIVLKARISCRLEKGMLQFKILKITSNLEATHAPEMNVTFDQINLPPVTIGSAGHQITLDTSRLKAEIQKHASEIGKAVVHSGSSFVAGDLVLVVNQVLSQAALSVSYDVSGEQNAPQLSPFGVMPLKPMDRILFQIQQATKKAHFDASLSEISFQEGGNLDTSFQLALNLDGRVLKPTALLDRCAEHSPMGALRFETASAPQRYGFAVAVSEPLVNATLDLANSVGLVRDVLNGLPGMEGITLGTDGVKVFFVKKDGRPKIIAIISLDVDISKRPTEGFWPGLKQAIGMGLEKTLGAGGHLKFPLQIEIEPSLEKDAQTGEVVLSLKSMNPVHKSSLDNSYGCSGNLSAVTDAVKEVFFEELTKALKDVVGKTQSIPIAGWIKSTGITFSPMQVDVESSGHLVIYGNLEKIDWSKL